MNRFRLAALIAGAVAIIAIAVAGMALARGGEHGEGDADKDAAPHVASPAGYQKHNQVRVLAAAPTSGWAGEAKLANEDTWEPYIAADPSSPYVYATYNRYGVSCPKSSCPNPEMLVRVSSDNGATWGAEHPLCACTKVSGQWDPTIAVTSTGTVYATWMNYNTIVFAKSTDRGQTWSGPLTISSNSWSDKPWMGTSADGADIYVAFESRSVFYMTYSHDGGSTWSAPKQINSDSSVYRYANGLVVLPNRTAVLADSKYPSGSASQGGPVDIEIWRSTDLGVTWTRKVVDTVYTGVDFRTSSTTTVGADRAGTLVMEYSGATSVGSNGHVWVRRSTDGGQTWGAATQFADGSANASFPAIVGGAAGDFRLTWMDARGGAWNVYYRSSSDGGQTWASEVDVSDASSGATYKSAAGFTSGYGDYDGIAIMSNGRSIEVAGEGVNFSSGPGAIWMNRQN